MFDLRFFQGMDVLRLWYEGIQRRVSTEGCNIILKAVFHIKVQSPVFFGFWNHLREIWKSVPSPATKQMISELGASSRLRPGRFASCLLGTCFSVKRCLDIASRAMNTNGNWRTLVQNGNPWAMKTRNHTKLKLSTSRICWMIFRKHHFRLVAVLLAQIRTYGKMQQKNVPCADWHWTRRHFLLMEFGIKSLNLETVSWHYLF